LVLIALAGLVWRIVYLVWMRNDAVAGVGTAYHFGALDLVDGIGFYTRPDFFNPTGGAPVAAYPPAWTIVLGGPSALGLRSWFSHQLIASVIGMATIVMTGLAARAAFGRRVGIVAAVLAACYPFAWLYERELLAEPLAMLGTATTIWIAYRFKAAPSVWLAVALGAAVGVMALTRSELLGVSVFLVAPVVFSARAVKLRRRFRWLGASGVACVLVIAPWAVYNQSRFTRPVPLSTALGSTLVVGNCPSTYEGELLGYYNLACALFLRGIDPDASIADGQYRGNAVDFMKENRRRAAVVAVARVGRTFGVLWPNQQMQFETERGTRTSVLRLGFVAYWVLLGFAIWGFVIARRRKVAVYPLLAFPVVALLSVLVTVGTVRYRAAAEISLIILAAVAIEAAIAMVRRRGEPEPAPKPKPMFTRG